MDIISIVINFFKRKDKRQVASSDEETAVTLLPQCCGIILLYALNTSYAHSLVKADWPSNEGWWEKEKGQTPASHQGKVAFGSSSRDGKTPPTPHQRCPPVLWVATLGALVVPRPVLDSLVSLRSYPPLQLPHQTWASDSLSTAYTLPATFWLTVPPATNNPEAPGSAVGMQVHLGSS